MDLIKRALKNLYHCNKTCFDILEPASKVYHSMCSNFVEFQPPTTTMNPISCFVYYYYLCGLSFHW